MMMEMRHNVAEIVDYSWKSSVPLHVAAMDFQKGLSSSTSSSSPTNDSTHYITQSPFTNPIQLNDYFV